ncbi:hypothetical protein J5H97_20485 [Escherichia coli]|nr:hypothetical protein [Escherichia coli]MCX3607560.1 hypothetical protein [Escherichia coli]
MKQEVEKWRPFGHPDGDIRDLSFLDAHQAVYVQHHEGKEPLEYRFWVTYSLTIRSLSLLNRRWLQTLHYGIFKKGRAKRGRSFSPWTTFLLTALP